jgi:hypothetical protein
MMGISRNKRYVIPLVYLNGDTVRPYQQVKSGRGTTGFCINDHLFQNTIDLPRAMDDVTNPLAETEQNIRRFFEVIYRKKDQYN